MFFSVALGAFAAHGLKERLDAGMLAAFETGVRYQTYHALSLFIIAWLASRNPTRMIDAAGFCFLGGIVLFSGSLYALSLSGIRKLGMVTPIGGLLFLAGWALLAMAAIP
jgi:uncharacterized membrane protein YgdD (TMEM256/DUF423 family)